MNACWTTIAPLENTKGPLEEDVVFIYSSHGGDMAARDSSANGRFVPTAWLVIIGSLRVAQHGS